MSGLANVIRSCIFMKKNIQYKEAFDFALLLGAAEKHAQISGSTAVGASAGAAGEGSRRGLQRRQLRACATPACLMAVQ